MANGKETTTVVTPKFRMAFVSLLHPRKDLKGVDKYEVVMLFPPDADISALRKAANNAIKNKWGEDKTKYPANLKSPFRSGDEESYAKYDGFKGMTVVRASSTSAPGVVDNKVQTVIDPKEAYSGRWAIAQINAGAYDNSGNRGVTFYLNHIQLLDHDVPFGGRSRVEDVFQPVGIQGGGKKDDEDLFG